MLFIITISRILLLLLVGVLAACSSTPEFELTNVDRSLTPRDAARAESSTGKSILWGGRIIETRNLSDTSEIEVLAYPLNRFYRPQTDNEPLGRFLVRYQGYLEPAAYAADRLITVVGIISEIQAGKVGESTYTYSVVNSEQLHLWSQDSERSRASMHLGIGIRM